MKAIAIIPGSNTLALIDRPEPSLTADDQVKMKVLRVGICGTDREEAAGGRAKAPDGIETLVLGHEMFGQVVEVGKAVTRVKPGDYAVFTVRRGCPTCIPCGMHRNDMCTTGNYHERGIWGLDGYQSEFAVDQERYLIPVPAELADVGVLAEPMSVSQKAIDAALGTQRGRLPDAAADPDWLSGRRCLVAGLGPIGLLAAIALRLRGADVWGLDVVEEASTRPQWLKTIGGEYINGMQVKTTDIDDTVGEFDLIFEATGVASVEFNLIDALAVNGVYVLTGIPGGDRPIEIAGADLMRQLVLKNQAIVGSVNAAPGHFRIGVDDLGRAQNKWGANHIAKLITQHHPYTDFQAALTEHAADEIKVVVEWGA